MAVSWGKKAGGVLTEQERVWGKQEWCFARNSILFLPPTPIRHYKNWFILKLPSSVKKRRSNALGNSMREQSLKGTPCPPRLSLGALNTLIKEIHKK